MRRQYFQILLFSGLIAIVFSVDSKKADPAKAKGKYTQKHTITKKDLEQLYEYCAKEEKIDKKTLKKDKNPLRKKVLGRKKQDENGKIEPAKAEHTVLQHCCGEIHTLIDKHNYKTAADAYNHVKTEYKGMEAPARDEEESAKRNAEKKKQKTAAEEKGKGTAGAEKSKTQKKPLYYKKMAKDGKVDIHICLGVKCNEKNECMESNESTNLLKSHLAQLKGKVQRHKAKGGEKKEEKEGHAAGKIPAIEEKAKKLATDEKAKKPAPP